MNTTQQQQESLKQLLADIQQPPLPAEFYVAPGYLLSTILLGAALFYLWRRWQRHRRLQRPRQLALLALAQLRQQLPADNSAGVGGQTNAVVLVLKQYIQTKSPFHPVLSQSSQQFLLFLQQSVSPAEPLPDADWLLYSGAADLAALTNLLDYASRWLQQHPESALDV